MVSRKTPNGDTHGREFVGPTWYPGDEKLDIFLSLDSPHDIRYSFLSYLAPEMFSFLNPIVFEGIKGIISGLRYFPDIPTIHKNADTCDATSDQISEKSNEAFA